MKNLNNFFSWLFADFFFALYEMAESKFTLQVAPDPQPKRRRSFLAGIEPYVVTTKTQNIVTEISHNGIIYHFDGELNNGNNLLYVLPNLILTREQRNSIERAASYLTDGSNRNLLGLGAI